MTKKGIIFMDNLGNTVLLQDLTPAHIGDVGALFNNVSGQPVFIKAGASMVGDRGALVPSSSGLPRFIRAGSTGANVVIDPCFAAGEPPWTQHPETIGFGLVEYDQADGGGGCPTHVKLYNIQTGGVVTMSAGTHQTFTPLNARTISFWYKFTCTGTPDVCRCISNLGTMGPLILPQESDWTKVTLTGPFIGLANIGFQYGQAWPVTITGEFDVSGVFVCG
jgi:hypothetical protein